MNQREDLTTDTIKRRESVRGVSDPSPPTPNPPSATLDLVSPTTKKAGISGSRRFGVSGGLHVASIGATFIALVVAGFILAGYLNRRI